MRSTVPRRSSAGHSNAQLQRSSGGSARREFAGRADFPKCTFGEHIDVVGYTGVVVEIVKKSLKVLSAEGDMRSYNADVLRKLYGKPPTAV